MIDCGGERGLRQQCARADVDGRGRLGEQTVEYGATWEASIRSREYGKVRSLFLRKGEVELTRNSYRPERSTDEPSRQRVR